MTANPWPKHIVGDYSETNYAPDIIDLHRPYVDSIILVSPSGKPMKRELDLIDVWFDSGAMPYAQNHYPFENYLRRCGPNARMVLHSTCYSHHDRRNGRVQKRHFQWSCSR